MHPNLSFDQAPPISAPYRFFIAAPWFGVLAGLLLAWSGESAFASRWTPETLGLVHLIAVGFMLQAMSGALLQFIPVAVGGNVWRPLQIAGISQPLLVLGAFCLAGGFIFAQPVLLRIAVPAFVAGVGVFAFAVGVALLRTPAQGATLWTLRLAAIGLVVTTLLGAVLAETLARGLALPLIRLANVHLAWGLGGWALMLLAAVSYFVVPMFQLTQPYPAWFARGFGPVLVSVLVLWSAAWLGDLPGLAALSGAAIGLVCTAFAVTTLWLQFTRRRKVEDATSLNFRIAMSCLLVLAVSAMAIVAFPELDDDPRAAVWLGVLAFAGVFVSAISGMMYKIIPFLNWLHLQRLGAPITAVPNMKKMIDGKAMTRQSRLHAFSLVLVLAAVWMPLLTRPAGLAFAASCAWLGWNLIQALRSFLEFRDRIRASVLDC